MGSETLCDEKDQRPTAMRVSLVLERQTRSWHAAVRQFNSRMRFYNLMLNKKLKTRFLFFIVWILIVPMCLLTVASMFLMLLEQELKACV